MKKITILVLVGMFLLISSQSLLAKEEDGSDELLAGEIIKIGEDSIKFITENGLEYKALVDNLTDYFDKSYDRLDYEAFKKGHQIRVRGAIDGTNIFASFIRDLSIR